MDAFHELAGVIPGRLFHLGRQHLGSVKPILVQVVLIDQSVQLAQFAARNIIVRANLGEVVFVADWLRRFVLALICFCIAVMRGVFLDDVPGLVHIFVALAYKLVDTQRTHLFLFETLFFGLLLGTPHLKSGQNVLLNLLGILHTLAEVQLGVLVLFLILLVLSLFFFLNDRVKLGLGIFLSFSDLLADLSKPVHALLPLFSNHFLVPALMISDGLEVG